ncbi:MAG: FMN-binding protein [Acidaminococcaceae bacterium]|nr:FMN-binding protein [Acidaminococcaceae bacterium]
MLGIEHPSARISGVKILQQHETPGLVWEPNAQNRLLSTSFLAKTSGQELIVSKNAAKPQEIQAITASTITSKAVVKGINAARRHYQEHFGVSLAAAGKGV